MKQRQRQKDHGNLKSTSILPIAELDRSPGSSPRRQQLNKTGTTNDVQCLLTTPANERR